MDSRTVPIVSSDGRHIPGEFRIWDESPGNADEVLLELHFAGRVLTAHSDSGFFDALCEIRRALEADGFRPVCYGADRVVYPSPMIRSMGNGEKAYRLTTGRQAKKEDLVSIFESDLQIVPVSVEEQEDFYEKWIESLK
jgi:hypothetical protein